MMSMKRTDSSSTTFSEIMQKNSMYQASLFVLNIVLIISSVVMIFSGYTLITTYHFDKIYYPNSKLDDLWPFHGLPWTMIGTGVSTLLVAILGFIFFALQIRPLIMLYAALLIPLILAKFGMIYITFKVESALRSDSSQLDNVGYHTEVRTLYHEKDDFRESWDILQTHLRCCGGENYEDFYHWNGLKKDYTCYPKSCCVDKDNSFGECVLKDGRVSIKYRIIDFKIRHEEYIDSKSFQCYFVTIIQCRIAQTNQENRVVTHLACGPR